MKAARTLAPWVGIAPACRSLSVSRATFYRRLRPRSTEPQQPRPTPARALTVSEKQQVLDLLNGPRFVDAAPAAVVATLLDEERYLCSERTMYRLLAAEKTLQERRRQRRHPVYTKPELLATAANQVWSWDITRLRGPQPGWWFYLYVVLDIFSRYVVGWMLAEHEREALAQRLLEETSTKQGIPKNQLTLHSDRGSPMTAKDTGRLLVRLGISQSFSRPRISNDNPFSEAQFKTLKYHPSFPDRFGSIEDAIAFCRSFFRWYNTQHRHAGIAMLTPEDVHCGKADHKLKIRQLALDEARRNNPQRFVRGRPTIQRLPRAVWINPPEHQRTKEVVPIH